MRALVQKLIRHFSGNFSFSDDLSINEIAKLMQDREPSLPTRLTWECKGKGYSLDIPVWNGFPALSISKLPDSSGFICFERPTKENNCLLVDAYGKERMRLVVPWEMAGNAGTSAEMRNHGKPKPQRMWFENVSEPYAHPETNEPGKFGVRCYLEYGDGLYEHSDYYFELDWCTGGFLWGRPIRD